MVVVLAFIREYIPSRKLHFSEARFKSFFIELNKPKKKANSWYVSPLTLIIRRYQTI